MKVIHTADGRTLYKSDDGRWLKKGEAEKMIADQKPKRRKKIQYRPLKDFKAVAISGSKVGTNRRYEADKQIVKQTADWKDEDLQDLAEALKSSYGKDSKLAQKYENELHRRHEVKDIREAVQETRNTQIIKEGNLKKQQMEAAKKQAEMAEKQFNPANTAESIEAKIGGTYKATPQMVEIAQSVYKDMVQDFPILAEGGFEIQFNKYMEPLGYGFQDRIELKGASFKKYLLPRYKSEDKTDDIVYWKGVVAHELTHAINNRINTYSGVFNNGSGERMTNLERIWYSAVDAYLKDHPNSKHLKTRKDIDKYMSNAYSGGGHSRAGGNADERMAVAIESLYRIRQYNQLNKSVIGSFASEIGKYVAAELKKESKGLKKK